MSGVLQGTTAVVTGVTSGIGEALAARLVEEGADVVGVGRGEQRMQAAASEAGFTPVVVDLADRQAVQRVADELAERLERVDLVVHNAAQCVYATPLGHDAAAWAELMQVNLLSVIALTEALAPRLPDGTGQLVAVSSVTARHLPNTRFAPYGVSKTSLDAYVDAVRMELASRAVRVTLLRLGLVDTPIYDKVDGFERTLARIRESPAEWLSPEEVVDALIWAVSQPPRVSVAELTLLPRGQQR